MVGFPERFEIQAEGSGLHKASEALSKVFRHCRDIQRSPGFTEVFLQGFDRKVLAFDRV